MNYFIEGLQGSGKSTLVSKLAEAFPGHTGVREGEYSPVELAWCAYVDEETYRALLKKYSAIRLQIEEKTVSEGNRKVICYTKIPTDLPGFYEEMEQYEIYNNRRCRETFRQIILERFKAWHTDNNIFECSLFQNIVEDMILFQNATDEEIIGFYRQILSALQGKDYHIFYLETTDVEGNLFVIRRERTDAQGNEAWFSMMMDYFNHSPYAKCRGVKGEQALLHHFHHRQALEIRICRELFPEKTTILPSKAYEEGEVFSRLHPDKALRT